MPAVVFYFQVHQPFRLARYSYFTSLRERPYFDVAKNREILCKVAQKCYLPTNRLLLQLIDKHAGKFRIAFSLTGIAVEQMREYCPDALESFVELAETGCVEFLAETYYHSLAAVHDQAEFVEQIRLHGALMNNLFGQQPKIFRNTELIYSDEIGALARRLGYRGILAEGADDILGWRSPNFLYRVPTGSSVGESVSAETALLLKNYRLSDDIAFRFSNREWADFPLTADKFARWVHQVSGNGDVVNLFMDYETFGEHQWESTGIFQFLEHLPEMIFKHPDWGFATPTEAIERFPISADLSFPRIVSWADIDRDLTAWQGNRMQLSALRQIYELGGAVRSTGDAELIDTWRKLQTSDHFYYMCTKWFADGDVHAYFSPYESPYEAFINYMNVLRSFREELAAMVPESVELAAAR